jgi:hypothetical protein
MQHLLVNANPLQRREPFRPAPRRPRLDVMRITRAGTRRVARGLVRREAAAPDESPVG